jgi:hypothetical protein
VKLPSLFVLGAVVVPALHAQTPAYVRDASLSRIPRAQAMAKDPALVQAVVEKNAGGESMDEVRARDREWRSNPSLPLRKTQVSSACGQRLRELTKDDAVIVEAILMDAQGANVCVSRETSDYWQGDEPKFQKSFGADKEVFLDEPALDASTGAHAVQLSVIVFDKKLKVGALTLTLRVAKPDAAAPNQ